MSEWQGCLLLAVPERSWHHQHLTLGEGSSSEWYRLVMRPPLVSLSPITSLLYFLFSWKDFSSVGHSVFFNESFLSYSREQLVNWRAFLPLPSCRRHTEFELLSPLCHLSISGILHLYVTFVDPRDIRCQELLISAFLRMQTHTQFLKHAPSSYPRVYPDDRKDGGERENMR